MKKVRFLNLRLPIVLLWMTILTTGYAQSPATDLDSITEDSYQRMLARQKAEQELDSVRIDELETALSTADVQELKEQQYLMLAFLIMGIGFSVWYIRRNSLKLKK